MIKYNSLQTFTTYTTYTYIYLYLYLPQNVEVTDESRDAVKSKKLIRLDWTLILNFVYFSPGYCS